MTDPTSPTDDDTDDGFGDGEEHDRGTDGTDPDTCEGPSFMDGNYC